MQINFFFAVQTKESENPGKAERKNFQIIEGKKYNSDI